MLKVIELFSGIGAQTQALKNIGIDHKVVGISEIDKFAIKSYEAIHGPTNNMGDITKIEILPDTDLLTFSFPCSDLSIAGRMQGMTQGTRSGLVWEVLRLLKVSKKPKYLLMENVKNLVGEKFKDGFDLICKELEKLGYTNYWQVLNAKDYGIPQNRERVFMISILNSGAYYFPQSIPLDIRLKDVLEEEVDEKYYLTNQAIEYMNRERKGKPRWEYHKNDLNGVASYLTANMYKGVPYGVITPTPSVIAKATGINGHDILKRVYDVNGIAPTINTMGGGNREPKIIDDLYRCRKAKEYENHSPTLRTNCGRFKVEEGNKIRKLTPLECWRLMGFSDEAFYKAKEVNSNSQLYKQAGNSIVVPVLEKIFGNLFLENKQKKSNIHNIIKF